MLKEMYPRLNNGNLPNLEDMLNMFNDFSEQYNYLNPYLYPSGKYVPHVLREVLPVVNDSMHLRRLPQSECQKPA